jgi:hypothetical protein
MVEEEDVVNGQQEALPTQQQRAVIAEMHEIGAAGRDWKAELLIEEAAQTRRHQGRRRLPLEPTLLGFLDALTNDDELVVRIQGFRQ